MLMVVTAVKTDLAFYDLIQSRIDSGRARPDEVADAHTMLLAEHKGLLAMLEAGRQEFYPGFCGEPNVWSNHATPWRRPLRLRSRARRSTGSSPASAR